MVIKAIPTSRSSLETDTLRGLACVLLVSFHVLGDSPNTGLRLTEGHWLTQLNELLAYLRMPLFSIVSGYVYAFRPCAADMPGFMKGKMRRLLLPMLTVGTAFAVLQALSPGSNSAVQHWWLLHIEPVGHFWFLQSLFLVFLVVAALERLKALQTPLALASVWGVSVFAMEFIRAPAYFGLSGALYLLPFFIAGLCIKRLEIDSNMARLLAAALLMSSLFVVLNFPETLGAQNTLAGAVLGSAAGLLLLRSGWLSPALATVGTFSFAIYLFHVFFTAASRLFFSKLGIDNVYALLVLGTTLGVGGPMIAACLIRSSSQLNFWLLGTASGARAARLSRGAPLPR
jgi:fucose 4-O-acetylase-like acetyltransferase